MPRHFASQFQLIKQKKGGEKKSQNLKHEK